MIKINGKILYNDHISKPTCTIEEWLNKQHSPEEIAKRLRLGDATLFDTDDDSKEFSAKDLETTIQSANTPITIFETDKLKELSKGVQKIKEQQAENN